MYSNAFAFASANANAAFALALAFDCPVVGAFELAFVFDSSAFAHAFDWNQMHLIGIKCETNANQFRLCYGYIMFIFLIGFAWNLS